MPITRRPQQFTNHFFQRRMIDATSLVGERLVVLRTFHPSIDHDTKRCPDCYSTVYKQSAEPKLCPTCYGTTFSPAFKEITVGRGIVGLDENTKPNEKTGEYSVEETSIQLEAYPRLYDGDIIFRVEEWFDYDTPKTLGDAYKVHKVSQLNVRTGTRKSKPVMTMGQKATVAKIPREFSIYQWKPSRTDIPLSPWPQP